MLDKYITYVLGSIALVSMVPVVEILTPEINRHISRYNRNQELVQERQRFVGLLQAQLNHIPEVGPLNSSLFAEAAHASGPPLVDEQRAWSDLNSQVALVPEVGPLNSSLLTKHSVVGSLEVPEKTRKVAPISTADKISKPPRQLASKGDTNQEGSRSRALSSDVVSSRDIANRKVDKLVAPPSNRMRPLVRFASQSVSMERRKSGPAGVLALSVNRSTLGSIELPETLRPTGLP